MADKIPFDIDVALERIADAIRPFPPAALFALAEDGSGDVFQQVVACMLSIRTRDETTLVVARDILERAGTPLQMLELSVEQIDTLIRAVSFHEAKARQIRAIAERAVRDYDGALPCDRDMLLSLPGIGPKCANLVMAIACRQPFIAVDIHVHRITNRWGYIRANTPEVTMLGLQKILPEQYRVEINALLVPFGKNICTPVSPRCSVCPLLDMCEQRGVENSR
jgi:endonuclease III